MGMEKVLPPPLLLLLLLLWRQLASLRALGMQWVGLMMGKGMATVTT